MKSTKQFYFLIIFIALIIVGLGLGCSSSDSNKTRPVSIDEIKNIIHPGYFSIDAITADVIVTSQSPRSSKKYQGQLVIDRSNVSRLSFKTKNQFFVTISANEVTVGEDGKKPIKLDLENKNHDISILRELLIVEPNPFLYLRNYYNYSVMKLPDGSYQIIANAKGPERRISLAKINVDSNSRMIRKIEYYSKSGDLVRRIEYKAPTIINGVLVPTKIILDSAERTEVLNEVYKLTKIQSRSHRK